MADDIEKLRKEIDALNDELAVLVQRRAGLAQRIGALKGGAGYRSEREAAILRRVAKTNSGPLGAEPMLAVFREIISSCRALEEPTRRLGGHQAVWRGQEMAFSLPTFSPHHTGHHTPMGPGILRSHYGPMAS